MPNMRQLTIEFPLEALSEAGFPLALLRIARSLRSLRQDTYGFQTSCKVQTAEISAFKKRWEQYESITRVATLHPADKDGLETALIRGPWLRKGSVKKGGQAANVLRTLSKCQRYLLRPPEVVGEHLQVAIDGEQSKTSRLLARFDKAKVPYRITSLCRASPHRLILFSTRQPDIEQMRILRRKVS